MQVMADYTAGSSRLHMAYSFDMLGPQFTAAHFRGKIEAFFKAAPDGWPAWAFSNHDVIRHVTRWADHGDCDGVAKLAAAMLLSFEGTIYLYQGEELGQTETEIEFHELTDPPGITFWPEYKGRDGCRTPMVWDSGPHGGFTTGVPWLPVKPAQLARNVAAQDGVEGSVLEFYRQMLAFRRGSEALLEGRTRFYDVAEPVLMFDRVSDAAVVRCVFNLSSGTEVVAAKGALTGPSQKAAMGAEGLTLGPNGFAFLV